MQAYGSILRLDVYVNVNYEPAMTMEMPKADRDPRSDPEAFFSIHDLIAEFGVTARTIRHYEAKGMLRPLRKGRHRLFGARERTRLKLILRGRRLGFSLADVRDMIDLYDAPAGETGQLACFMQKIAERRRELQQKQRDIRDTLDDLGRAEEGCRRRLAELGKT